MPESCRDGVGYWASVVTPFSKLAGDWVDPFPHNHVNSMNWSPGTTTVITYLVAPDAGGEFGLGGHDPSDPYEFIKPEPGLSISIDATVWHGVKPVQAGARIALMSTGWPNSTCHGP